MPYPTREGVFAEMKAKGYKTFEGTGDYNLNLIGLRAMPGRPNRFDDWLTVSYKEKGIWQFKCYPCTTDPGYYWLTNPGRVDGTAILIPGQYRSCWKVGMHKGQYPALVQNGAPFKVWRDNDKDGTPLYGGEVYDNVVGLNLHHAGESSVEVGKWSAACQVLARMKDWNELWGLIEKSAKLYGDKFSYTLLEEDGS